MPQKEFRLITPQRRIIKSQKKYSSYKKELQIDFNKRCGYCDSHQCFLDGLRSFQIDHFIPKSKFKEFENLYSNLVYSCPICNRAKSNDWPTEDPLIFNKENIGYIDPCSEEYTNKFFRNKFGEIRPKDSLAEYIHCTLKLGLIRHRLIWNLDKIKRFQIEIEELEKERDIPFKMQEEIKKLKSKFFTIFLKIFEELKGGY